MFLDIIRRLVSRLMGHRCEILKMKPRDAVYLLETGDCAELFRGGGRTASVTLRFIALASAVTWGRTCSASGEPSKGTIIVSSFVSGSGSPS